MGASDANIKLDKARFLEALRDNRGLVTHASKACGISFQRHYDWLKNDIEYKKDVEAVGDVVLDFVEDSLHKQIDEMSTAATIFYLKTKGKKRGYIEQNDAKVKLDKDTGVISIGFKDSMGRDSCSIELETDED